jgi:hypothetical protein
MATGSGSVPAPTTIAGLGVRSPTFERLAVYLLFLAIAGAAAVMPAQSDTFWQLRAGAETVASGRVQLTDTLTHTVRGRAWPNHEWASETAFYLLHRAGGFPLLTLVLAVLVTCAWWNDWRLMVGSTLSRVVLVAVFTVSSARLWSLRPQVVSLCLLVFAVRLMVARREWWLPVLFLAWANLHGGAVLGICAIAGAAIARAIVEPASLRRSVPVLCASAAAVCLTPLGPALWTDVPFMLERLRSYGVAEWQPTSISDPWNMPFWAAAVAVPLLTWKRRARLTAADATVLGAWTCLTLLAVQTTRNVMPALMLAAPAVSRLTFASQPAPAATRRERPTLNLSIAAVAGVCVLAAIVAAWNGPAARLNWRPLPVRAASAIAACPPNLYNLYDHGGYITWFVPSQPVFVDSRQDPFPPAIIGAQIEAERTGAYEALFRRHGVNCAALPVASKVAQRLLGDGWRTRFSGDGWIVLARPSY